MTAHFHHINMLLADRVVKAFEVQGHEKSATIQIVEGDISQQYTHVLINVTDACLLYTRTTRIHGQITRIYGKNYWGLNYII